MKKIETKQVIRILLLLGTVVSLYFVPWPIVKAWIMPLPGTLQEQVDQAAEYGFDGIIVCVNRKGNQSEFYTSGYKNRENKIPADPDALFKIASVSKLYTALAIAKLAHDGKLSLDATLAHYFPELIGRIENADRITVRMMVQHRSGIPNFTDAKDYWVHPKQTADERLELALDKPADFEPGAQYAYSNTNFLLLSQLIAKVTGGEKFHYIRAKILDPLHLKNTFGSIKDVNLDDVMSGYYVGYKNDLKTDNNGVMLATAEDLAKFIRALNDGSAFSDPREKEIYSALYKFEHTGMIPGYQTIAQYHKALDAVVIQFTNTANFEGYNWNLSEIMYSRIIRILKRQKRSNES